MLYKLEVSTVQGTTLVLPLGDYSNGFKIKGIDGLDPVKATLVSSSYATVDGEQYQSSRRDTRNIILKIGLQLGVSATVRSLRTQLYNFLMPKSVVRLRFYDDIDPAVDIYGVVETFTTPLFTKEPEVAISLVCHNPDFYEPTSVILSGNSTSGTTETLVNYTGSVDTGILFKLNVNRTMSGVTIYRRGSDNTLTSLALLAALSAGDLVTISTVPGAKGATLTRAGIVTSLLYGVSPYSDWIRFLPGSNYTRVYNAEGAPVPYTIEYTKRLGGL